MKHFYLGRVLRLIALILVVSVGWGISTNRLAVRNWQVPFEYDGDGLEFISWIQAASEGDFIPFVREGSHRLAAPYQANWDDYPTAEKFYICFLGVFAKIFGLYPACNFGMVLAHVLCALSFYACCRFLRYDRAWSFVGAVLYGLTYYNSARGLGNLHLACSWLLPFAILTTWLVLCSKRLRPGNRLGWICLVTAFLMSLGTPYNLNMFLQLLCFSILVQFLTRKRKANLRVGFYCIGAAIFGFVIINAHTLVNDFLHGKNSMALARNYFEAELYALKPIEFIIPPVKHNLQMLADIGAKYQMSAFIKGEMFSAYLGIIAFSGFVWMFAELFVLIVRRKFAAKGLPPHGLQIVWIMAYAIIGGVNCLISLAGFQLFRATNRYSIFISLLCLMFGVSRLSRLNRPWLLNFKLPLAGVLLLIGLTDQLPRPPAFEEKDTIKQMTASDKEFSARLEEKLPPGGMVFELPVMVFPESPSLRGVQGYQMLRPYVNSRNLRFSYGAIRGRPREDWQWDVEKLPAPQMISQLEGYGFAAVYLNRKCYADQGEDLLKQFAAAGRNQFIEDSLHGQVCVLLNPSAHPTLPHMDDRALLRFGGGWAVKNQTPGDNRQWESTDNRQWAGGDASVSFFSEESRPTPYTVSCGIGSVSARRVSIHMKGRQVWSGEIPAGAAVQATFMVDAAWRYNTLVFKTDEPPARSGEGVPLAFTVINLEVKKTAR
jgi:uncharacterized membrane protein YhaH (DUF805 family)